MTTDNSPLLTENVRPSPEDQSDQGEELEGLDAVPNELGDLGMGEEDLLGMGDNFDIFEFADALDDLENMPEGGEAKKSTASEPSSSSGSVETPVTQPPPYTTAPAPASGVASSIRAPPPPYPGHQGGPGSVPSKVNFIFMACRGRRLQLLMLQADSSDAMLEMSKNQTPMRRPLLIQVKFTSR